MTETSPQQNDELMRVFLDYCGGRTTMDGRTFVKLARDTKLFDKQLTDRDVDLAFASVRTKHERRISYQ